MKPTKPLHHYTSAIRIEHDEVKYGIRQTMPSQLVLRISRRTTRTMQAEVDCIAKVSSTLVLQGTTDLALGKCKHSRVLRSSAGPLNWSAVARL